MARKPDPFTGPIVESTPQVDDEVLQIPIKAGPELYQQILSHAPKELLKAAAGILVDHMMRIDRLPEVLKAVVSFVAERANIQDKVAARVTEEAAKAFLADLGTLLDDREFRNSVIPRIADKLCDHKEAEKAVVEVIRDGTWISDGLREAMKSRMGKIADSLIESGPVRTKINKIGQEIMDEFTDVLTGRIREVVIDAASRKGMQIVDNMERTGMLNGSRG